MSLTEPSAAPLRVSTLRTTPLQNPGRAPELLAAIGFYVTINFDAPYTRLLQPLLGMVAVVVLFSRRQTKTLTLAHGTLIVWLLSSAFIFAPGANVVGTAVRLSSGLLVPVAVVAALGALHAIRIFVTTLWLMVVTSIGVALLLPTQGLMAGGSWRGIFAHKNQFGFCCGLLAVVCLAELVGPNLPRRRQHFLVLGLISAAIGLLAARSATAIGVVALCAGVTLALGSRHQAGSSTARTGLALCLAASPVVLLVAASDRAFELLGRDGTLTGRSDIWRLALKVRSSSSSQWVGRGLDFWSPSNPDAVLIWRAVKWTPFSSHNSYLDWWLMLGTIGVLLILAWVSSVLIRSAAVSTRQGRLICLFPLALCVSISSFTEQYLVAPIGLMLLALVSAASIEALSRTHDSV